MEELGRDTDFSQETQKAGKAQFVGTCQSKHSEIRKTFAICLSSVIFDWERNMCDLIKLSLGSLGNI